MPRRPLLALALSLALAAASYVPYRLVTQRARGGPAPAAAAAPGADPAPAPRPAGPKVWRWSDPATWGGKAPRAGAAVTIPKGRRVLLDVSPPPLRSLKVKGVLGFADRRLSLRANWIMVHGRLTAGTASRPLRSRVTITLTDRDRAEDVMGMGANVLGVMGGTLELHGQARTSWLHLAETAPAGSRRLVLERDPGWRAGDRLVVASTDYEPSQTEEVQVAAVAGRVATLERPLRFGHWGRIQGYGRFRLDERGEVGLLSRNLVVQGDPAGEAAGFGGHIMAMGGKVRMSGVELYRMGQRRALRRYPVHFHMMDDARGSYLRDLSIHHSLNRGVTIHGTDNVVVQRNVAYDVVGHTFFLEDGAETGNLLEDNLAVLTRRPPQGQGLLDSDEHIGPSSYWVTNPDNTFRGNVAAASEGIGFWVALPEHPTGLSRTTRVWPRRTRLRQFDGNVAHSNDGDGLRVDNGPKPDGTTEVTVNDPRAVPANAGSRALATRIDGFGAWKNRGSGVWTRLLRLELTHATLADNPIGVTLVNNDSVVRDSLIVSESANTGTPAPYEAKGAGGRSLPRPWEADFPIRGFEFYDGRNGAERVHFEGFTPNAQRQASAFSYLRFTAFPIDARNWASGASFGPGVNRVALEDREVPEPGGGEDGYRTAVFFDADGSVTGSPRSYVTVDNPFLVDGGCRLRGDWNAWVCRSSYSRLSVSALESAGPAGITLTRADGASTVLRGIGDRGAANGHHATLAAGQAYSMAFEGGTPRALSLVMTSLNPSDSGGSAARRVKLSIPWPHGSPKVTRYGQPYPSRLAGGTLQLTLRLANPGEQYTAVEVRA